MTKEDMDYIFKQIELSDWDSIVIPQTIQRYKKEYDASIAIGLTSKNYTEREKAFYNSTSVMEENNVDVLPASFMRKPSDIIYSCDHYIRLKGIQDKDFRRSILWLVTGEDKKLPKVSDAKDKEVKHQEHKISLKKKELGKQSYYDIVTVPEY